MEPDDLLKMLNLKPKQKKESKDAISQVPLVGSDSRRPLGGEASPHALQLDRWDSAKGGEILRHNKEAKDTGATPQEMSDFFASAFLTDPTPVEKCTDERRLEYVKKTLESPDFRALHRSTELNPLASELASVEFAQSFSKLKEKDKERQEKNEKEKKKGKRPNPTKEQARKDGALARAVGSALKEASKEVENLEDAMEALGCGVGQGSNEQLDVGKIGNLFNQVKDSEFLKKVMNRAGAVRAFAAAAQRRKVQHGRDDVVGVVLDGDVGRLLPIELLQLGLPEFELDATRRLVERQMMCREYRGVEPVGKGPIVIVVDKSGSMGWQDRIVDACAFSLGMAYIARHSNRWCALIGFAGGSEGDCLLLPPKKWDEAALLKWLSKPASGGTTLDVPIKELPETYWPEFIKQGMKRGKTDIHIITDAIVSLPTEMEEKFLAWKKAEKARVITMVLGGEAGDLARVSDEVYEQMSLGLDQDGIQRSLSI
jgi:uncharacterized protein with von Willebrand factor type A (vWA) domain